MSLKHTHIVVELDKGLGLATDADLESQLDARYVPYIGANAPVDLGAQNLVTIGTFGAAQTTITGVSDVVQLTVVGNASQTSNLVNLEQSDNTKVFQVDNDGLTTIGALADNDKSIEYWTLTEGLRWAWTWDESSDRLVLRNGAADTTKDVMRFDDSIIDLMPDNTSRMDLSASQINIKQDCDFVEGITVAQETVTAASDTLDDTNYVVLCDCTSNDITINLPTSVDGRMYYIKKTDSSVNTVTVDGNSTETIDGDETKVITMQYDAILVVGDGSNWYII